MSSSSHIHADDELPFEPDSYRVARLDHLGGHIPIDHFFVRTRRANRRLTQRQAAEIAEITQNRWQQIEVPRRPRGARVTAGNLEGLAKALEVPPELLVALPISATVLTAARSVRGLTQPGLADACSIPLEHIEFFEDASTELEPKAFWSTIQTLAVELGLEPTALLIPRPSDPHDSPSGPGADRYKRPDGTSFTLSPRDSLMLRRFLKELPSYSSDDTGPDAKGYISIVAGSSGMGKTTTPFLPRLVGEIDRLQRDTVLILGLGGTGLHAATAAADTPGALHGTGSISDVFKPMTGTIRRAVRDGARILDVGRVEARFESDLEYPSWVVPGSQCMEGTRGEDRIRQGDLLVETLRQKEILDYYDGRGHLSVVEGEPERPATLGADDPLELHGVDTVRGSDFLDGSARSIGVFVLDTDTRAQNREAGWQYRRALTEVTSRMPGPETIMIGASGAGVRGVVRIAEMVEVFLEQVRASRSVELEGEFSMRGNGNRPTDPLYDEVAQPIPIYSSCVCAVHGDTNHELDGLRHEDRARDAGGVREESRYEFGGGVELKALGLVGERVAPRPSGTHSAQPATRVAMDAAFDPAMILKAVESAISQLDVEERAAVLLTCAREEGLDLLAECDSNRVDAVVAARGWRRVARWVECELGHVLAVDVARDATENCRNGNCVAEFVVDRELARFAPLLHGDEELARPC